MAASPAARQFLEVFLGGSTIRAVAALTRSVFPPNPDQTVRGRLIPGLGGSLQHYQVAAGFAECCLWSCLSWSDHHHAMIPSLFFQSSSSAPTDLHLLPLVPPLQQYHLFIFPHSLD